MLRVPTHQILILTPFCNPKVYILLKISLQIPFIVHSHILLYKDEEMKTSIYSMLPKSFTVWFCRYDHSEKILLLKLLLKTRSYSWGNRRNVEIAYIFLPTNLTFTKDFLTFYSICNFQPFVTWKMRFSCKVIEKKIFLMKR